MERWIMNRLGFVNFWVYDEEVFPLRNGKILLRGSNGSGKSITTQSFIPYILDGDRQPSRLDPFGSKDRKMSFYLLDDRGQEKDESTGYLFLEFKKPESEQYRTIGIGLHARKGGNMNTWGFCILDGRRIGYDFSLYRSAGGRNIPYDARKLKEELGEDNLFAEKMSEYKEMVAKNIFGISPENISDYDNLTDILIKTRSSKLASKENLKPAQLYEVLNESMKTLSDEDLRPMADAMNRIEEIHGKIEDAERALAESKHICAEYRKYNIYVLWNKGKRFLRKHSQTEELSKKVISIRKDIEDNRSLHKTSSEEYEKSSVLLSDLKREKDNLDFSDINARISQRIEAESNLETAEKEEKEKSDILEEKKKQIGIKRSEQRTLEDLIDELKYELDTHIKEYKSYEEYQFPMYDNYLEQIKENKEFGNMGSICRKECQELSLSIKKAFDSLKKYENEKRREDEALLRLDKAREENEKSARELDSAEKAFDEEKDRIIEKYYGASGKNEEFIIDEDILGKLEKTVSEFEGSSSASEILEILSFQKNYLYKKLVSEESELKTKLSNLRNEFNENKNRLEELKSMEDPVPERSLRRIESRKKLEQRGIKFYSYYECIDFKDDVDDELRCITEAALLDSGMLDALVIPDTDRETAEKILGDISDCIIIDKNTEFRESRYLKNVFDFKVPFPDTDEKGFFSAGLMFGHSESYGSVRFIGAESRKRYREKLVSELEEIVEKLDQECSAAGNDIERVKARMKTLDAESDELNDISDLGAAYGLLEKCRNILAVKIKNTEQCETDYSEVRSAVQVYKVESERACSDFPYSRDAESFSDAYDSSYEYLDKVQDIISVLKDINERNRELSSVKDTISDYESYADLTDADIKALLRRIHGYKETIRLCNEFLNSDENINKKERALELEKLIRDTEDANRKAENTVTRCSERLKMLEEQYADEEKALKDSEIDEIKLKDIFTEELNLGLTDTEAADSTEKTAAGIEREISETEKQKSLSEIQERLSDSYRKHSSILSAEYGMSLEHCFEDDDSETVRRRMQITLMWMGKKISPFDFEKELSETIENDRVMIRHNEENMFKEILLNTISKKLYCRIEESREWVDSMSALMREINTSMGLTFSLSWKPRKDISDREMDYDSLSRILVKSRELISSEDFERLSEHFRSKIEQEKLNVEEKGEDINYTEIVRNVLDFRNWFEFRLHCRQAGNNNFSELTNSRFNTFSGGERALCLYIPLFAAVAAQYKKAGEQAPMIIALDEAFAGVDDSNISEMFGLLEKLGFGYIMNSQALWGCYETVPSLEIAELFHEKESGVITVIFYEWNGRQKILEE